MTNTNMEWPRLAKFDEYYPVFGIYQKSPDDPVQLAQCGDPPIYFGTLTDVQVFCNIFGLDYPPFFSHKEGR